MRWNVQQVLDDESSKQSHIKFHLVDINYIKCSISCCLAEMPVDSDKALAVFPVHCSMFDSMAHNSDNALAAFPVHCSMFDSMSHNNGDNALAAFPAHCSMFDSMSHDNKNWNASDHIIP
jgi:hypothetical protein